MVLPAVASGRSSRRGGPKYVSRKCPRESKKFLSLWIQGTAVVRGLAKNFSRMVESLSWKWRDFLQKFTIALISTYDFYYYNLALSKIERWIRACPGINSLKRGNGAGQN